ncbi:ejaculatory bulb-specific protein 3-like [Haematobia irritans]|uniref:ejaculatory bulb-specific protein 3-like n=1 Tax=Haematobia irritans TaxID=7368 RepID=UPI003F50B990
MKFLCLALAVVAFVTVSVSADDKYTTKYDNINYKEILGSDRLYENYHKCLVERGPCTPDGRDLKSTIPEALKNACNKCSDKQKKIADEVLQYLKDKRKSQFEELLDKYDPERIYLTKYSKN